MDFDSVTKEKIIEVTRKDSAKSLIDVSPSNYSTKYVEVIDEFLTKKKLGKPMREKLIKMKKGIERDKRGFALKQKTMFDNYVEPEPIIPPYADDPITPEPKDEPVEKPKDVGDVRG